MKLPFRINQQISKLLIIVITVGLLNSCRKVDHFPPRANEERADVVYGWYKFIAKIQQPSNPQPVVLLNNRNFGYIGVGLYESVQPGIKGGKSLASSLYQMPDMPKPEPGKGYLWSAAANAALPSMFKQFLTGLTDANKASLDSLENVNNNIFRLFISEDVLNRSQAFGRAIADAIYTWSTTDNFSLSSEGYVIPVFPGSWEPTPPAKANPVGAFLKDSRPFLEYSLTAIIDPMPFDYSEEPSSDFYEAVNEVYEIGNNLTDEQKAIADWFADSGGPGVGLPAPYHLLSIITGVLEKQKANLGLAAEMYAKCGIGQKDGPINIWRGKFHYNLVRPITYIQAHIDQAWTSYLITPPYPDYPSGLAALYCSALQPLIREFGDVPVIDNAYDWRGLPARHYASLTELIDESAESRILGGIHYRFTQDLSVEFARILGNKIADIKLTGGPKH